MEYNTKSRRAILELFAVSRDTALSTEDITNSLSGKGIGVSTLYRQLAALCKSGELVRHRSGEGEYIYRYAGEHTECECAFHLKCTVCGSVSHLDCPHSNELIAHIGKEHGFALDKGRTVLYGECAACMKKEAEGAK